MLLYNRIDISEGIDLAKSNKSKERVICHYWFFNHEFTFQSYACNGCHDLTILAILLLSLLKMLVTTVFFITLANMKQLTY